MYRLSLLLLLLTVPFYPFENVILGIPGWAVASLGMTVAFALTLIAVIEKRWDSLKGDAQ